MHRLLCTLILPIYILMNFIEHTRIFFCIVYKKKKKEEERTKLSTSYNNGRNIDSFLIVIFNVHIITVIFSSTWSITSSDRADPSSNWSYVIHRVCKRNMVLAAESGGILFSTLTLRSHFKVEPTRFSVCFIVYMKIRNYHENSLSSMTLSLWE